MNGQEKPKPGQNLLGGYATGNLSPQEQELLMRAALEDQNLFDALIEEQALKEALDEPGARAALVTALQPRATGWERFKQWWATPVFWGAAGAAATACLVVAFLATRPTLPQSPATETAAARVNREPVPNVAKQAPAADLPARKRATPEAMPAPVKGRQSDERFASRKDVAAAPVPEPKPDAMSRLQAPSQVVEQVQIQVPRQQLPQQQAPLQQAPLQTQSQDSAQSVSRPIGQSSPAAPAEPIAVQERRQELQAEKKETALADLSKNKVVAAARSAIPSGPPAASKPAAPPVYGLLQRMQDGSFVPVTSGQAVATGAALKFQINSAQSGIISVSRRDENGVHSIVTSQLVEKGRPATIPAQGTFLANAGPQTLVVSFQPTAERDAGLTRQTFRESSPKGAAGGRVNPAPAKSLGLGESVFEVRIVGRVAQ